MRTRTFFVKFIPSHPTKIFSNHSISSIQKCPRELPQVFTSNLQILGANTCVKSFISREWLQDQTERMSSEEVDNWLLKISQWQKQLFQPNDMIYLQIQSLGKLAEFLVNLETNLIKIGTVDEALSQLSQVGQLLGRLTTIVPVVFDERTSKALLSCLMFFFVDKPVTPIECRARVWVTSQIRSVICSSKLSQVTHLRGSPGHQAIKKNSQCLRKVIEDTNRHLMSGLKSVPQQTLVDICRFCAYHSSVPYFSSVLEKIIFCLGDDGTDRADDIFKMIKGLSDIEDVTKHKLSYECQFALWTNYLPSLEHDVLLVCSMCLENASVDYIEQLLLSSFLLQACSDSVSVYMSVLSMVKSLQAEAGGHSTFGLIVSTLHESVRKTRLKAPTTLQTTTLPIKPL